MINEAHYCNNSLKITHMHAHSSSPSAHAYKVSVVCNRMLQGMLGGRCYYSANAEFKSAGMKKVMAYLQSSRTA